VKTTSILVKIVSLVVAVLLITLSAVLLFSIRNQTTTLYASVDQTLETNTKVLITAIQTIMLTGEAPIAVRTLEKLQSITELDNVDIFRPNGERAFHNFSTLESVNMTQSKMIFPRTERLEYKKTDSAHFQKVVETNTPVKIEMKNPHKVEYHFPLINAPECRVCHGSRNFLNGVLHFSVSIDSVYRRIRSASLVLILIFVVADFVVGLSLILSIKEIIVSKLKALGGILNRVGAGDFTAQVTFNTRDELGLIATQTNDMITKLKERTESLQLTQDVTILSLASLAETRDNETGSHILRTQRYVRVLAEDLVKRGLYTDDLSGDQIDLLYKSAPLHDIGKVGVPDSILRKPGKLDESEWIEMKKHAQYGYDALRIAEERLGSSSFLRVAGEIALTHHEKWDGSGYPRGIAGKDIPLAGRLMAIADVYDALITKRVYKEAFSHEKATAIIVEGKETHFDPYLVDTFLERIADFMRINLEFKNAEE
jgi:response regulator RpfG family c-di-GMP phosphodiesterase